VYKTLQRHAHLPIPLIYCHVWCVSLELVAVDLFSYFYVFLGLRTFFKSFFKKNEPIAFYAQLANKIGSTRLGERLYQDDNVRIDLGEPVEGGVNVVWQKQKQTKNPALKAINSTHSKIATQIVNPNDPENGAELHADLMGKV
jgi:hypothetical protein